MGRQHVLVVSASRPIPAAVRDAMRLDGHYVFEAGFDNIQTMLRTVFVDAIVIVGECTEPCREKLNQGLGPRLLARTVFVDHSDSVPAAVALLDAHE